MPEASLGAGEVLISNRSAECISAVVSVQPVHKEPNTLTVKEEEGTQTRTQMISITAGEDGTCAVEGARQRQSRTLVLPGQGGSQQKTFRKMSKRLDGMAGRPRS